MTDLTEMTVPTGPERGVLMNVSPSWAWAGAAMSSAAVQRRPPGGRRAVETNIAVLLTPEEVDEATKKAVGFRPPGG